MTSNFAVFRTTADDGLNYCDIVEAETQKQAIKKYMATSGTQLETVDTGEEDTVGLKTVEGVPYDSNLHRTGEGEEAVAFGNDFVVVEASSLEGFVAC
ncbi:hypothetical protein SAMN05443574_103323 [Haloarcula vallismortis]|uniref:Uncharacterized protein n=2 Tax=Haloarcula vallismortis TaxID=28442 RepID=M0JVB8_HALVA|nr:hypothetical protein [Haloarcula vallismortis]EMA11585.1 hypothetical protein C437_01695 [Haloarcula vallismortis ATCC 29715]SDW45545.1 hypothetical protein SAMN05443574_103323 [Haloarcula vallismortis]